MQPLAGQPLVDLNLSETKVTDLSPLQGMPIELLQLSGTPIAQLAPLRGLPVAKLALARCANLADFTPLQSSRSFLCSSCRCMRGRSRSSSSIRG